MKVTDADMMFTYSGKTIYPCHPELSVICIDDIAHALSLSCRFGGHITRHYSIAQHCILGVGIIMDIFDNHPEILREKFPNVIIDESTMKEMQKCFLMHDATEAYVADIVRPLKRSLPVYNEIEGKWHKEIAKIFKLKELNLDEIEFIKYIDNVMLMIEASQLLKTRTEKIYLGDFVEITWKDFYSEIKEYSIPAVELLYLDFYRSLFLMENLTND